jgi:uncharacterized membrane protein (GlpM family)
MEILLKSVVGGAVIGIVLLITKVFGPKVGGILAMVPMMFTLAFIMATYGSKAKYIQNFIGGSIAGSLLFLPFLIILYFLNKNADNYWLNLIISYVVWLGGAFLWVYFKK